MIPYRTFPLIELGPLQLRTFGLLSALGVLLGVHLLARYGEAHGIDPDRLTTLAIRTVVIAFVGSRITYVLTHLGDFTDRPLDVFAVWKGGLQFSGGFLAAIAYLLWWRRSNTDVPRLVLADGLAYALSAGLIVGRLGCYSVGEHFGGETDFFLGTRYEGGETIEGPIAIGTTIHNTALYEALGMLALVGVLTWLRRRDPAPGTLTAVFALWYGVQRFATDSLRVYDDRTFGLTGAQYLSMVLVVLGALLLARLARNRRLPVVDPQPVEAP